MGGGVSPTANPPKMWPHEAEGLAGKGGAQEGEGPASPTCTPTHKHNMVSEKHGAPSGTSWASLDPDLSAPRGHSSLPATENVLRAVGRAPLSPSHLGYGVPQSPQSLPLPQGPFSPSLLFTPRSGLGGSLPVPAGGSLLPSPLPVAGPLERRGAESRRPRQAGVLFVIP